MAEVAQPIIQIIGPRQVFYDHECSILAVTVFRDGRRMVTGSHDKSLRLWDLKNGTVLKKMEGHRGQVEAVAVSQDGKSIASGDLYGEVITWDGETGEPLTQATKVHSEKITSLDFSPDGVVLATGSLDKTWRTETRHVQENPINSGGTIHCIRHSPSSLGELLAIATANDIQIWNLSASAPAPSCSGRECIVKFRAVDISAWQISLTWTPDGTRLLSGGSTRDPIIREWDTSTWKQVGGVWRDHTSYIYALAVNSTGTLIASASLDTHVRLWRLSDRRILAIFKAPREMYGLTFSMDDKHVLCGGRDANIIEWDVPEDALLEDIPMEQASHSRDSHSKILSVNTTVCDACVVGDIPTAERILTEDILAGGNNHNAYANRSFVIARKGDWDIALDDALRSVSIQPSLTGYISKGIALCGKMEFQEAMKAFDIAFMFTDTDSNTILLLLLIKAIALFNANQHEDAMLRIKELAAACPYTDILACRVVEAYLLFQLGINAFNDSHHDKAADHFTAAINTGVLSYNRATHSKFDVFVVLFGWNLESSWQIANQNRCYALLRAGRLVEAHEAHRCMMDEATTVSCLDWSTAFKNECNALYGASGDAAIAAGAYDEAIKLYSAAIDLGSATDSIFANRCKARLGKMLWEDALIDAQKVTELSPSFYLGYKLKHEALHIGQQYDEAIEALIMASRLDRASDTPILNLVSRSEAEGAIHRVTDAHLENAPLRLINTSNGRLYDRGAQIDFFKASTEYKKLLSLSMECENIPSERIHDVVLMFFQYVMLSHRWEGKEPPLRDIQGKSVYELNPADDIGIAKLQSFCKVTLDREYQWAWSDTCCIDKNNIIDLQQSVNSMFLWYHCSALTIVYLSDVLPGSESGALAKSAWNSRGWTVQEFLAPQVILFYQNGWTLYLDDRSSNHKESTAIMQELGDATGIDVQALTAFRPEMRSAREKLQWSSKRSTTLQEDIAYSLCGIFGVNLSPMYGEKKQIALGRLLQQIILHSGDITCLDWVGKSSEFNSCLPANITSYAAHSHVLPSLTEDEMQTSVSSLRDAVARNLVSQLYTTLERLPAPSFPHRRLVLSCIVFTVAELRPDQEQETYFYTVKADGLRNLRITTEDKLTSFSRTQNRQKFLLVRPWDRNLLELSNSNGDTQSMQDFPMSTTPETRGSVDSESHTRASRLMHHLRRFSVFGSLSGVPGEQGLDDSESYSRALRLIVYLGQPFRALLLIQQHGGGYKRIASDCEIVAQVSDTSVRSMMDSIKTLEIS